MTKHDAYGGISDPKNLSFWCCKNLLYVVIDRNIPLNEKFCSKIDGDIVSEDDLIGGAKPISRKTITLGISICLTR